MSLKPNRKRMKKRNTEKKNMAKRRKNHLSKVEHQLGPAPAARVTYFYLIRYF